MAPALALPRGWSDAKYVLLLQAFLGEFVQGGLIFGWNALALMLRNQGAYSDACPANGRGAVCTAQENSLAVVWTVGVFALNSGPVLVGPILDWLGPKLTLLLGVALNIAGLALVGCAPGARGALPAGAVLMGLGGITFHLAQFHVSNLFPLRRGLISSLMVAGFTGCGIVFYFLDLIYNAALRARPATLTPAVAFRTVSLGYAGVCALWVPLALWLAPWHALRVGQAFVHKGRGRFGVVERRAVEARATAEAAADARRATADVASSPAGVAMATLEGDRAGGPPAGLAPIATGRGPPGGGDGLATLEAAASPSPGLSPGPLSGEAALAYMGAGGRGGGGGSGGGNAALLAPDGGPGAASPTASASGAPLTGPTASSFLYPGADSADPRWADLDSPTAADRDGSGLGAGTAGGPGGATQPAAGVTYGPLTFEARRFVDLREKSFWAQFTSPESTGMGAFYTLNVLAIQFYLGTARLQLGSKGDAGTGYAFTKFATILPAFGFVAIPAAAWLLDTKGYGATLGAINLLGVLASLCQALPGLKVQALTLALWATGRFLLYTSYFAIFGALFGFRNFGRMVAIDNTVNGLVGLLQLPLTTWALHGLGGNFTAINLLQAAFLLPLFAFCWAMRRWETTDLVPIRPAEGEALPINLLGPRPAREARFLGTLEKRLAGVAGGGID